MKRYWLVSYTAQDGRLIALGYKKRAVANLAISQLAKRGMKAELYRVKNGFALKQN